MRAVAWALIVAFTFAIPWEYSLDFGEPFGNIARLIGLLALLAAIPAVLQKGRVRLPGALQWCALAFFAWFVLTLFWTTDAGATLYRVRAYLQQIMIVWLVWEFAESPMDLRSLLRAYVAGAWVLAILTAINLATSDTLEQIRFVAEGQDPNDVARYLGLGLPMATLLVDAESGWFLKLLATAYVPLGAAGILLTASREGFIGTTVAFAGCGWLLYRSHRRTVIAGACALPVIFVLLWFTFLRDTLARLATIPDQIIGRDLNQRWDIWASGWQAFTRAPLIGSGAGSFVTAAGLAPIDTAHNTILSLAVEGGIVAVMLAAAIVAVCALAVFRTQGHVRIAFATALAMWMISSVVATQEQNRTTWLLFAMIALAERLYVESAERLSACLCGAPSLQTEETLSQPVTSGLI